MAGWQTLTDRFPWFVGQDNFPLPAYSEFMPPPRLGLSPCGELDSVLFAADDPYGWRVSEFDELYQVRPGFENVANHVMRHVLRFLNDRELDTLHVAGPNRRNLKDNPYWSEQLASHAAELARRRHVLLLALSMSKTQNDRGRRQWTLFGASEQGPERAFWQSFYSAPGVEIPQRRSREVIAGLLSGSFGVAVSDAAQLHRAGFRVLPSDNARRFPQWAFEPLPKWTHRYLVQDESRFRDVRFLLTFRPFSALPEAVRAGYLEGRIELLPSPLTLLFWGMSIYHSASRQHPLAIQYPVLRLVPRHEGLGLRVPQFGWLRHSPGDGVESEADDDVIVNEYARTHRWERLPRDEDPVPKRLKVSSVATTLFSTDLSDLDLYGKPMARNAQIWTRDGELILDGPRASRAEIKRAAARVLAGGAFLYAFRFPPMRIGTHEAFWQRPLAACAFPERGVTQLLDVELPGYITAYDSERSGYESPVELYPRLLRRPHFVDALLRIDRSKDYYRYQTALNVVNVFDMAQRWGRGRLPREFAEQMLRIAQDQQHFEHWLDIVAQRSATPEVAERLTGTLAKCVESKRRSRWPKALTYAVTATREYEEAYWRHLVTLSHGEFVNKANSDVVDDAPTRRHVSHAKRDLQALGDFLIGEYRAAIAAAGMDGVAYVGELPFKWDTDFEYEHFGGWVANQEGREYERNILMVIPGKDRSRAVVMGDHYDTAYMEDVYETSRGGNGARISAQGADDNGSATATLLLAAPIYLQLAREGRLERDVWLIHLTGEEFPSDCMGARAFCQSIVERTLKVRVDNEWIDLSNVELSGVLVMDMIAHNRESERDVFQISPGRSAASLQLAYQAHVATMIWNGGAARWNRRAPRAGRARGVRSADALTLPGIALHPVLDGQVRTTDNPQSSVFNTDVQIFSDIGAACVLIMENYDIDRSGYHDTKDTLANIDLDYGAAVSAICIETIARVATAP
jgi:hypothetical protein